MMDPNKLARMNQLLLKRQREHSASLWPTEKEELIDLLIEKLGESKTCDDRQLADDQLVRGVQTRLNQPG